MVLESGEVSIIQLSKLITPNGELSLIVNALSFLFFFSLWSILLYCVDTESSAI